MAHVIKYRYGYKTITQKSYFEAGMISCQRNTPPAISSLTRRCSAVLTLAQTKLSTALRLPHQRSTTSRSVRSARKSTNASHGRPGENGLEYNRRYHDRHRKRLRKD